LLPVGYFHLVFTLPGRIADIAYHSKAAIYGLLFTAAAEATLTIAADPKRLGARIGITAVLHSWGSAMTHHPHVHMIVPGGGISLDGTRWVSCRPRFFLPVRVLSRLFRRLFLGKLLAAHQAGRLAFFGDNAALAEPRAFAAFLAPLRRTKCRAVPPETGRDVRDRGRRSTPHAAASVSLLRRPHDHHRDLRTRLPAETPSRVRYGSHQDRHLVMPSPPIRHPSDARPFWLALGRNSPADCSLTNRPAVTPPTLSGNARCARSARQSHPSSAVARLGRAL
jgi:hypothetical protein